MCALTNARGAFGGTQTTWYLLRDAAMPTAETFGPPVLGGRSQHYARGSCQPIPVGTFHRIGAVSVVGGPPGPGCWARQTEGGSDSA